MHEGGITSLPDPSGLFLTRYAEPVPGTCVTVAMEGRRALVTEVQALIGATVAGSPRRTVSGLDAARLAMVLAVLQRRAEADRCTTGRSSPPPSAASGWSSRRPTSAWRWPSPPAAHDLALAPDLVAIGEVGLTGEVRRVGAVPRRLAEAARLGFRFALVPTGLRPGRDRAVPGRHAGARGRRRRTALHYAVKASSEVDPR